jgi:hypothetical protein
MVGCSRWNLLVGHALDYLLLVAALEVCVTVIQSLGKLERLASRLGYSRTIIWTF